MNNINVTVSEAQADRKVFHRHSEGGCTKDTTECCKQLEKSCNNSKRTIATSQIIPDDILLDSRLNSLLAEGLPRNYNFEVHKCIWQARRMEAKRVALQMPEGLLAHAPIIADILKAWCKSVEEVYILGDVTYGACCIDDFTAEALGCDLLVHYGHSCLIPITVTSQKMKILYVFVEIQFDTEHLVQLLRHNFTRDSSDTSKIALMGTIQFVGGIHQVRKVLMDQDAAFSSRLYIPQARPLSPGEVLGCTSPRLPLGTECLIFVADGRFHLEAAMIANPNVPAYRYDPYSKKMTLERYDHTAMHGLRREAIEKAKSARRFGLLLSTLGRQGSPVILADIEAKLQARGMETFKLLMSEIRPENLAPYQEHIDVWVQVACPRLSIDWGSGLLGGKPLLSPYELNILLGEAKPFWKNGADAIYPMDYYAKESPGPWTVYYKK